MPWYLYALAGAALDVTYYALVKKHLKNIDPYTLGAGIFLFTSALLWAVAVIRGLPALGPDFYLAVAATGALNIIATVLNFRAFQTTELSLALPMLSFTPAFLILTSLIILKETPSSIGVAGIVLIVIGSYILNQNPGDKFLEPFKQMFRNKGVLAMLVVAFLYSISSSFDKMVVVNSDVVFGSAVVELVLGLSFLVIALSKGRHFYTEIKSHFSKFAILGVILALIAFTINTAFTASSASYVISIKRLSILFAVLFGGLVLKEVNFGKRLAGAAVMVAGAILIVLFGK